MNDTVSFKMKCPAVWILAALLLASPAFAKGAKEVKTNLQEVKGNVLDVKLAKVRGSADENLVLQVQRDSGGKLVADLGATEQIKKAGIKKGDAIVMQGKYLAIKGKPFFFAKTATVGSQTYDLKRRVMGSREFNGTIDKIKKVGIQGFAEKHHVATVLTAEGKKVLVDLGPEKQIDGMKLKKGDQVRVKGHKMLVKGKPVLVANEVQTDTQSVKVKRKAIPGKAKQPKKA